MVNDKTFFEKHFLLLLYSFFLALDCYFLYTGRYGSRMYSKPILMVFLLFWFHRRTSLGKRVIPPNSLTVRICIYAVFVLSFVSDVCALWSDIFVWSVCRLLYIPMYILYLIMLIEVVRRAKEEKKVIFYVKKIIPVFLLMSLIAFAVLWKAVGFGADFYQWCLYFHAFVICLLATVTANMWGYTELAKCRILFAVAVVFIILTNTTFCFDEIYYNRRYHILDVFVALGNGAATIFMLFGVMRVLKDWRKVEY